jgi:hypothetical protein
MWQITTCTKVANTHNPRTTHRNAFHAGVVLIYCVDIPGLRAENIRLWNKS